MDLDGGEDRARPEMKELDPISPATGLDMQSPWYSPGIVRTQEPDIAQPAISDSEIHSHMVYDDGVKFYGGPIRLLMELKNSNCWMMV